MSDDMDAGPVDGRIGELARDYNRPPEVPRDAMWAAIEARLGLDADTGGGAGGETRDVIALGGRRAPKAERADPRDMVMPFRRRGARWAAWAAAAAAVLAVGVGIGRYTATVPGAPAARVAVEAGDDPALDAIHTAAAEHLGRSQELLSVLRTDARTGHLDPGVGRWGRELLVETRLLLDTPAGSDPALGPLLEDLELILAQVALLGGDAMDQEGRAREELDIIARGMDDNDMLPRIQAVVPMAPGLAGT